MGTLIGIAAVVLVGFAIFVLQQDAAEQKRAAE
jgi:preprotein translocase subunit Sss1